MKRVWQGSAKVLGGLLLAAMYAMPQAYTISARPGAINYIEGNAFLNGSPVSEKALKGDLSQRKRHVVHGNRQSGNPADAGRILANWR